MELTPNHILRIQISELTNINLTSMEISKVHSRDSKRQTKQKSNAQNNYGFRDTPVTVEKLCRRATV